MNSATFACIRWASAFRTEDWNGHGKPKAAMKKAAPDKGGLLD